MSEQTAVLYVNRSDSRCGACNQSALPWDERHETPCGYDQHPGCGALFVAVSSDYFGTDDAVRRVRPDLPFLDPLRPDTHATTTATPASAHDERTS